MTTKKTSKPAGVLETISCGFNIFQEGREYSGNHRKYVLEAARKVCYAPATRESLKNREKVGYFGHGQRLLAGKLRLEETEAAKLEDGSAILVQNVPSNVTTAFEIDSKGNVDHTQDILDTEPGRIVAALNRSHVGGFSWAMGQGAAGALGLTRVTSFAGFDYVIDPGFNKNRGYVLESASGHWPDKRLVLESLASLGIAGQAAEAYLNNWTSSANFRVAELEDCLGRQAQEFSALQDRLKEAEKRSKAAAVTPAPASLSPEARRDMILEAARRHVIDMPSEVIEAMLRLEGPEDFQAVMDFTQRAGRVNLSRWPVRQSGGEAAVPSDLASLGPAGHQYGTAAAGLALAAAFDGPKLKFKP